MEKKPRKPGSGRKPLPDRGLLKEAVTLYLESRVVNALGGKDKVKAAMTDFATTVYNQIKPHDQTFNPNHRAPVHPLDA